jgi:capsular exopolysaccharide synthesis family protein
MRTPDDLKRFGFRTISTLSRMEGEKGDHRKSSNKPAGVGSFDPHLISFHAPLSPLAESYRNLRTNIQFAQVDRPLKTVMVTSANPSEGKSTTVANLAIAFAQSGKRVLLVDADLHRPSLHKLFNIRGNPGLSDFIFGNSTYDGVVQKNIMDNLDIICSGTAAPNPAEVPGSQNMKILFSQAKQVYDIVLFDSPPVLSATEVSVLAAEVDGTVLVVSWDETRAPEVEAAMESLGSVGAMVLGVLLNNFNARKAYGGYTQLSGRRYGYGQYDIQGANGNGKGKRKVGKLRD